MISILCYGDSNTWGYDPATGNRFPKHQRWPGVMQEALGSGYDVIAEGLNGRTTIWDDPTDFDPDGFARNGQKHLIQCLNSHMPLDLVIVYLGTNDLKRRLALSAYDISSGASVLVSMVQASTFGREGRAPNLLSVCPPPLAPLSGTPFEPIFNGGESKSRDLHEHYKNVADTKNVPLVNAGEFVENSPIDGIHHSELGHERLGNAIATKIQQLML